MQTTNKRITKTAVKRTEVAFNKSWKAYAAASKAVRIAEQFDLHDLEERRAIDAAAEQEWRAKWNAYKALADAYEAQQERLGLEAY